MASLAAMIDGVTLLFPTSVIVSPGFLPHFGILRRRRLVKTHGHDEDECEQSRFCMQIEELLKPGKKEKPKKKKKTKKSKKKAT